MTYRELREQQVRTAPTESQLWAWDRSEVSGDLYFGGRSEYPEPNTTDEEGQFVTAACRGDVATIERILALKVDNGRPVLESAPCGKTVLHLAAERGHTGVVREILAYLPTQSDVYSQLVEPWWSEQFAINKWYVERDDSTFSPKYFGEYWHTEDELARRHVAIAMILACCGAELPDVEVCQSYNNLALSILVEIISSKGVEECCDFFGSADLEDANVRRGMDIDV